MPDPVSDTTTVAWPTIDAVEVREVCVPREARNGITTPA